MVKKIKLKNKNVDEIFKSIPKIKKKKKKIKKKKEEIKIDIPNWEFIGGI